MAMNPYYPAYNGYGTNQQPFYQTYQAPMQYQPYQQNTGLRGRLVNKPEDIAPGEVVMDGGVSFFPQSDYSCIYAKLWDKNGQIQTFKFVPEAQNTEPGEPDVTNADLAARLDKIEKTLYKMRGYRNDAKQEKGAE